MQRPNRDNDKPWRTAHDDPTGTIDEIKGKHEMKDDASGEEDESECMFYSGAHGRMEGRKGE
jgi:hypothetical protein